MGQHNGFGAIPVFPVIQMRTRIAVSILAALASLNLCGQARRGIVEPLGETSEPNLTFFVLNIAAGATVPARTHSEAAFAFVIEGDVESKQASKAAEALHVGTFFRELRGEPARMLKNLSSTAAAKVLILQNSPSLPAGAKALLQTKLTNLQDQEVTIAKITTAPNDPSPNPHQHPGPTFAYLWKGEVKSQIDPDEPETFHAGEVFLEVPERVHRSYLNVSKTESAELLLFGVAGKGQRGTPAK